MERENIETGKDQLSVRRCPIKVVARAADGLRQRLDALFTAGTSVTSSRTRVAVREVGAQAAFVAHTYTMTVQHVDQLGALHADLKQVEGVVMVL
jgi:putative lipoic acid-binding regulatory protein